MRLRLSSRWRPAPLFGGAALLAMLLAGSCLNPQPDPFPQASEDSAPVPVQREGTTDGERVGGLGVDNAALPPAPEPVEPAFSPESPAVENGDTPAGAPPPDAGPDSASPSPDAGGPDAGTGESSPSGDD